MSEENSNIAIDPSEENLILLDIGEPASSRLRLITQHERLILHRKQLLRFIKGIKNCATISIYNFRIHQGIKDCTTISIYNFKEIIYNAFSLPLAA